MNRIAGIALLAVLAIHVAVRPEHGWILLSGCDLAALATSIGLIGGWHRWVAVACLFQVMVGLPSFALGVFTTYDLNPTGVIIHLVPPVFGAIAVSRHGMPRRAALAAWGGSAFALILGYLLAPPALNVNFAARVWPPLARVFEVDGSFQAAGLAAIGVLLVAGELIARKLVAGRARGALPAAR